MSYHEAPVRWQSTFDCNGIIQRAGGSALQHEDYQLQPQTCYVYYKLRSFFTGRFIVINLVRLCAQHWEVFLFRVTLTPKYSLTEHFGRPYRDAQDRLLWKDKTCSAHHELESVVIVIIIIVIIIIITEQFGTPEPHPLLTHLPYDKKALFFSTWQPQMQQHPMTRYSLFD